MAKNGQKTMQHDDQLDVATSVKLKGRITPQTDNSADCDDGETTRYFAPRRRVSEPVEPVEPRYRRPDLVVQWINPLLGCPPEAQLMNLDNQAAIALGLPQVEVRHRCDGDLTTHALWLSAPHNQDEVNARNDMLGRQDLRLNGEEEIGVFIGETLLLGAMRLRIGQLNTAMQAQAARTGDDPPFVLNDVSIRLQEPNIVVTTVDGTADALFDIDFTATRTETMNLQNTMITCRGEQRDIGNFAVTASSELDLDDLDVLENVAIGVLPPFIAAIAGQINDQRDQAVAQFVGIQGIARILADLANTPIPLPQRLQLFLNWTRRAVVPGDGITAHGAFQICDRQPMTFIAGSRSLTSYIDAPSVRARYTLIGTGISGGLNNVTFMSEGTTIRMVGANTAEITFYMDQRFHGSDERHRVVTCTATTGEGMMTATLPVTINYTSQPSGGNSRGGRGRSTP